MEVRPSLRQFHRCKSSRRCELKKLGIRQISRNTVKKILKGNGFDPGPKVRERFVG
jgi:hypothetical protein